MKISKPTFIFGLGLALAAGAPARAADAIEIPFALARGQVLYDKNCSSCHGTGLGGTEQGPPLIHAYYKPSHHDDQSIYRAVMKGVRQHHWNFGDMPPVAGMTPKKTEQVVRYVRYYQQQKNLY